MSYSVQWSDISAYHHFQCLYCITVPFCAVYAKSKPGSAWVAVSPRAEMDCISYDHQVFNLKWNMLHTKATEKEGVKKQVFLHHFFLLSLSWQNL